MHFRVLEVILGLEKHFRAFRSFLSKLGFLKVKGHFGHFAKKDNFSSQVTGQSQENYLRKNVFGHVFWCASMIIICIKTQF